MRLWPFRPKSDFAPGDLCRIRNHPDIWPRYRGAYCIVVSGLVRRPHRPDSVGKYAHQVECRRTPAGAPKLFIGPECPFRPRLRSERQR